MLAGGVVTMEKLILIVEDVADALQMSVENVLRLLRNRKLRGLKEQGRRYVFQESLKTYVLDMIAKRFDATGYIQTDDIGIKNDDSTRQQATLNRLSTIEGDSKGLLPDEAAVKLQSAFSYSVFRMGVKDRDLREDVIQEMSLATLKCSGPNTRNFYLMRARSKGRDFLRSEWFRGMKSIDSFEDDEWEKIEPAIPLKVDCSAITKLFKLAGIPLDYMQEHGIRLVDDEKQDFVSSAASAEHTVVGAGGVPSGEDLRTRRCDPPVKGKEDVCSDSDWKESA